MMGNNPQATLTTPRTKGLPTFNLTLTHCSQVRSRDIVSRTIAPHDALELADPVERLSLALIGCEDYSPFSEEPRQIACM